jgi:hypothetical protein
MYSNFHNHLQSSYCLGEMHHPGDDYKCYETLFKTTSHGPVNHHFQSSLLPLWTLSCSCHLFTPIILCYTLSPPHHPASPHHQYNSMSCFLAFSKIHTHAHVFSINSWSPWIFRLNLSNSHTHTCTHFFYQFMVAMDF